jgi:predicted MPP superfamily phosphohydrolase
MPRTRRRRRRTFYFVILLFVVLLPEAAVLQDLVLPHLGLLPTLGLFATLQIPIVLELTARGSNAQASGLALAGWQLFFAFWTGAFLYALFGGWARLVLLLVTDLSTAAAPPPLLLAAVPFVFGLWGVFVGQRRYPRRVVHLAVEGLPRAWAGAKIVQLSDLHVGRFIGPKRLSKLAMRAQAANPDIVLVTGDIVDSSAQFAAQAAEALASIRAPLGVWAVLGNHDHYAGAPAVRRALEAAGVRVLVNSGTLIERGGSPLWLCGVDDLWHGADLDAALAAAPTRTPVVLLSHQPNIFPAAAARGVALQLSGHTHAGQIALPFFRQVSLARLISPFVAGVYRLQNALLYVNRGAGAVRPLIRVGAPPEVAVLSLEPALSEAAEPLDMTEPEPA